MLSYFGSINLKFLYQWCQGEANNPARLKQRIILTTTRILLLILFQQLHDQN